MKVAYPELTRRVGQLEKLLAIPLRFNSAAEAAQAPLLQQPLGRPD